MSRTVAYVRVSSKGQNHAMQVGAIEREAAARGASIAKWYAERMTAKSLDRPMLARLRDDARHGRVYAVYLFKLDRLTRSGVGDTFRVIDEFRRAGVTLVSVSDDLTIRPGDGVDVATDALVFALSLGAQIERAAINERVAAARSRVESEGGRWGRPRRVGGATVATMRAMQAAGKSIRAIAIATKVHRSSVARALSRKGARKPPAKMPRDRGPHGGASR